MRVEEKQVCDLMLTDPMSGEALIICSPMSVENDFMVFYTLNPKNRLKWKCLVRIEEAFEEVLCEPKKGILR